MRQLHVDVWSDIACPWCYVGKRRLASALARFPRRDAVTVRWRAFELDATAPPVQPEEPYAVRLARKYRTSLAEAEGMLRQMTATAASDGLALRFDRIRPGNTFDAHRLVHLGGERGLQDAVKERMLRGYLEEGEAIGDREVLQRLAVEAGLAADEVREVLDRGTYGPEVRADEDEARARGIRGVPFFVLGGRFAVSGAHPADALLQALTTAWDELAGEDAGAGAACGPDGCA